MQVLYVVYLTTGEKNHRSHPCAVVTGKVGVEPPYSVEEFPVMTSPQQQSALKAFNEVAKLSEEARLKLGISAEKLTAIRQQSYPGASLKPGDTVYLGIFCGEDGMSAPRAEGVFSYKPPTDGIITVREFIVARNIAEYLSNENNDKVAAEVSGVSAETKKFLRDFKP